MTKNEYKFLKLSIKAIKIFEDESLSWEEKYDAIFSEDISRKIRDTGAYVDWCDPDTSYEEDVTAYIKALREKAADMVDPYGMRSRNSEPEMC